MKVCHFSTVHSRYDTRIFVKQCSSLADYGHEVYFVVADGAGDEVRAGVRIIDALQGVQSNGRLQRMTLTVFKVFTKVLRIDAQINHFHDPELIPSGLLLRMFGKKVIYDVHEDVPQQILIKGWLPSPIRKATSAFVLFLEKCAEFFLSGIVTVTPKIALNFPKAKTVIVRNYPIQEELCSLESRLYDDRDSIIAYVGAISSVRGIKQMIDAIHEVSTDSARLLLAGLFQPPSLEAEMRKLEGWSRVDSLGWQTREQVTSLLGRARVGLVVLHPTLNYPDAYPVKLFEYMAAGIPVVASDFPIWRDIVVGADCGLLVDPMDPQAIADAIEWLLFHPEEAKAMGERGRKMVATRYSWLAEKEVLFQFYESIA